ncbi:hypothetical protein, partial [Mesorhizobium sp. M1A.F.Ca.IN.022.05.2.1]|uniref:hypothetical protein n=1 Tax=Mesorhizobium sp. M1A.F.Ca.IN.022.05.2.1 TaxID=2496760 RepID=UPI0019CFCD63
QRRLVFRTAGLDEPEHRVSALQAFGTSVAGLEPEQQRRLAALADGLAQPEYRARALAALLP